MQASTLRIEEPRWTVTESAKAREPQSPWHNPKTRAFLLRKLFSLTGVVPLAGFTIFHLAKNTSALQGREAFTAMAEQINGLPFVGLLEIVFILVPLMVHAAFGILIVIDARYNVKAYGFNRNWMFTLQRVAGVLAIGFIGYHLYELRIQKMLGKLGVYGFYDALSADLSSTIWGVPAVALIYVVGIAAVAFHLANGLWGFFCSWGITVSRRSQRLSAALLGIFGIVLFALGANITLYFATGSKLFVPSSSHSLGAADHCPPSALSSEPSSPESPSPELPSPELPSPASPSATPPPADSTP